MTVHESHTSTQPHEHARGSAFATVVLAASAILLVHSSVGVAQAYFTTYATAKGTIQLPLDERTEINEEFDDWTKHVTITNTALAEDAASMSVFVRVKAFSGSTYPLQFEGSGWQLNEGDGYYYYNAPLAPGKVTEKLDIKITGVPADAKPDASFNVAVIYETTPVIYKPDGTPYADWTDILDAGQTGGGEA